MAFGEHHIRHLQRIWKEVIQNGVIEGDPLDIDSEEKFGLPHPGGSRRMGNLIIKYKSPAEVLEQLYPPWMGRYEIKNLGTPIDPGKYMVKSGRETWIYDERNNVLEYMESPQIIDRVIGVLRADDRPPAKKIVDWAKDKIGEGGTWVYYASQDPRLVAFLGIYMKKTMEENNLPVQIRMNVDWPERIVDRNGITRLETHVVGLRIPEGYYTLVKTELERKKRDLGLPSSAHYKDITDPVHYKKDGSFIVSGSRI